MISTPLDPPAKSTPSLNQQSDTLISRPPAQGNPAVRRDASLPAKNNVPVTRKR